MEENLFVYVDWLPVVHAASRFSVSKNVTKKVVSKNELRQPELAQIN